MATENWSFSDKIYPVTLDHQGSGEFTVKVQGQAEVAVSLTPICENTWLLKYAGRHRLVFAMCQKDTVKLQLDGQTYLFKKVAAAASRPQAKPIERGLETNLRAPMPGKLVKILVNPGEVIKMGQTLAILDSMKIEIALKASQDGVIKRILAQEGHQIEMNAEIVEFGSL